MTKKRVPNELYQIFFNFFRILKCQTTELVHTHTARRTGATLMCLSGMDIYDIMKITGHTSPAMLRKYIKAENLTVVEKITDKYNYFD